MGLVTIVPHSHKVRTKLYKIPKFGVNMPKSKQDTAFENVKMSGIFPDDWKCARVIPLFKQGDSSDLNNYRPISVISVVAKVFERIVYDQLYNFLSTEGIISDQQSGFRSLHLTVSALLEATDSWAFNIDRGYVNAVVFLDLKKAFDTVDHEILLTEINRYGIQGTSLDWFKSYLINRARRCSVNGCLSDFTTCQRKRSLALFYF